MFNRKELASNIPYTEYVKRVEPDFLSDTESGNLINILQDRVRLALTVALPDTPAAGNFMALINNESMVPDQTRRQQVANSLQILLATPENLLEQLSSNADVAGFDELSNNAWDLVTMLRNSGNTPNHIRQKLLISQLLLPHALVHKDAISLLKETNNPNRFTDILRLQPYDLPDDLMTQLTEIIHTPSPQITKFQQTVSQYVQRDDYELEEIRTHLAISADKFAQHRPTQWHRLSRAVKDPEKLTKLLIQQPAEHKLIELLTLINSTNEQTKIRMIDLFLDNQGQDYQVICLTDILNWEPEDAKNNSVYQGRFDESDWNALINELHQPDCIFTSDKEMERLGKDPRSALRYRIAAYWTGSAMVPNQQDLTGNLEACIQQLKQELGNG